MMPLCIYLILSLRGKIIMSNTNCSCYVSKIHDVLARHGGTCLKSQRLRGGGFKAGLGQTPELLPVRGSFFFLYGSINLALQTVDTSPKVCGTGLCLDPAQGDH